MPDSKSGVLPLDDFLVLKKNCGLCGPQFKKLVDRRLHLHKGQHTRRNLQLLALLLEESFVGCAVKHIDVLQSEVPQAYQPLKKLSISFPRMAYFNSGENATAETLSDNIASHSINEVVHHLSF